MFKQSFLDHILISTRVLSRRSTVAILAQAISLKRHVACARCPRVLVCFRIDHWFTCVRHWPVVISSSFTPFSLWSQVMSQPRHSARLAARFQSARSSPLSLPPLPMSIDLTDTEPISDGLSNDPVLSEVWVSGGRLVGQGLHHTHLSVFF